MVPDKIRSLIPALFCLLTMLACDQRAGQPPASREVASTSGAQPQPAPKDDLPRYARRKLAGHHYDVIEARAEHLSLHWRDGEGQPYRSLERLEEELGGDEIVALMNAGIFEPGLIPTGLHVEAGRQLRPLNLDDGEGNFFMKPNGVFSIDSDQRATITSSGDFEVDRPRLAVQSGPLLLDEGQIHAAFGARSKSNKRRNGVGVCKGGVIALLSSQVDDPDPPNLWSFARAFAEMGCQNAVYLDGTISMLRVPGQLEPAQGELQFAAMLVVHR